VLARSSRKKQTAPGDIQNVDQRRGSSKKKAKSPPKRGKSKSKTKAKAKDKRKLSTAPLSAAALRKELEAQRNQVIRAADSVAQALHLGPWPSPQCSLDPSAIEQRRVSDDDNVMAKHTAHMSMVGASIAQFAQDVIVPSVMEELARSPPNATSRRRASESSVAEGLRVFLGTLLMIRELFVLNAMSIFGPSGMITGRESDFDSTLDEVENDLVTDDEAAIFSVRILATTIILAGLADLGDDASEDLSAAFLDATVAYE